MEDKRIIQLLWDRTEQAVDALAAKFGKRLLQTALNILSHRQDAEEAVNDTYLALWNAIPPAKPEPLAPFVYRVGRNTALKHLRQRSAQKRDSSYDVCLDELAGILPGPSMEETLDARALGSSIDRFLETLDKDSRILFVRRYWFGDSVKDIGRAIGVSENVLSVRLHRLRGKLKDYLYKEGFWNEA